MDFKRKEGESEKHFIWRLYNHRDKVGGISDRECGDICNKELGLSYDESRHRKIYQQFISMWSEVKEEYISEESLLEQLEDIDDKMDGLYKQQVKTRDKLREYRKTLRDEARIENLIDVIYDVALNMSEFDISVNKIKTGNKTAILRISDWHIGKDINSYWNKFNKAIAKERVDKLIFETVKYCETFGIGELYVGCIGDMIDGAIHGNARVANEENHIEQIMTASELISYMLECFVEYGLDVKYLSVLDNHSRANKSYHEHIEKENFGKIIQWYVEARLGNKVDFIENMIDENIGYVKIDGKSHYFVHGHLKAHSLNSIVQNLALSLRTTVDYVHAGHWHSSQTKDFQFAKVYVNGSLCGVDEYAQGMGFFSHPAQSLIVIDGDTDIRLDIKLN